MKYHLGYIKLNIKMQVGNDMEMYNKVVTRKLLRLLRLPMKSYGLTIDKIEDKLHLFENGELIDKFNNLEDVYKYITNEYE